MKQGQFLDSEYTDDSRPRCILSAPNLVTLIRPACTLPFMWCAIRIGDDQTSWWCAGAFGLFGIITASDMLDGWLARRLGQVSNFGRLLDHVCDVLFIQAALLVYVGRGLIPWWLPVAIAWTFGLYALDSWWRTSGQPRRPLLPTRLGHLGGILYYTTVGLVTAHACLANPITKIIFSYGWIEGIALLALLSGADRLRCLLHAVIWPSPATQGEGNITRSAHSKS